MTLRVIQINGEPWFVVAPTAPPLMNAGAKRRDLQTTHRHTACTSVDALLMNAKANPLPQLSNSMPFRCVHFSTHAIDERTG
jgi:hypothetical protein